MRGELISHTLPNLINGISEQSPKVRLESQSQDEQNTLHDVSRGLRKRLPTHRDIKVNATDNSFIHYIDKGSRGLFAVIIDDGSISAYELNSQKDVPVSTNDRSYLQINDISRKSFAAVSVGDVSWILNKTKTVTIDPAISGNAHPWAAAKIKQIACAVKYTVQVSVYWGDRKQDFWSSYTIPQYNPADKTKAFDLSTLNLPQELVNRIPSLPSGVSKSAISSDSLIVWCGKGNDGITKITVNITDSMANSFTSDFGQDQTVNDFTDLPRQFWEGLTVKVKGDADTADDYYVKWAADGIWRETLKDGEQFKLNAETMPWRLNLEWDTNGDPYFNFVSYNWTPRKCGDTESNLFPSFVNAKCTDIFFHKNRLGLLSESNVVLSESSKYENFFVSTMRTALDTDMIDIASPTNEITQLSYGIPFDKEMIMFSPKTQFALKSGDTLTPSNVALLEASKYENDINNRPTTIGSSLFYVTKLGETSALWEMVTGDQMGNLVSNNVSAHVPTLINGEVISLSGTSLFNKMSVITKQGNETNLFIYSFHNAEGRRLQSAWSKWHFPYSAVVNAKFINSRLYVLLKRPDGYYIEHTNLDTDPISTELKIVPHLDSLREVNADFKPASYEQVYQDREVNRYFTGVPYSMFYQFSPQILKQQNGVAIADARLQLRNIILTVEKTGEFKIEVTPKGRETKTHLIATRIIGGVSSMLSKSPTLLSDDRKTTINSNAHDVKIKIISDKPFPLCIQSAAYRGIAVYRSQPQ